MNGGWNRRTTKLHKQLTKFGKRTARKPWNFSVSVKMENENTEKTNDHDGVETIEKSYEKTLDSVITEFVQCKFIG